MSAIAMSAIGETLPLTRRCAMALLALTGPWSVLRLARAELASA